MSIQPDRPPVTNADSVAQHAVAARFLDSYGVLARTTHITELGRVECMVPADGWARILPALVDLGATYHDEPDFLFYEARIDGVPVQVWVPRQERDDHLSALYEASNQRQSDFYAATPRVEATS